MSSLCRVTTTASATAATTTSCRESTPCWKTHWKYPTRPTRPTVSYHLSWYLLISMSYPPLWCLLIPWVISLCCFSWLSLWVIPHCGISWFPWVIPHCGILISMSYFLCCFSWFSHVYNNRRFNPKMLYWHYARELTNCCKVCWRKCSQITVQASQSYLLVIPLSCFSYEYKFITRSTGWLAPRINSLLKHAMLVIAKKKTNAY